MTETALKVVTVEVPEDTVAVLPANSKFKAWAFDHAYLLVTLSTFFVITWIVEVVVNIIWN